jgi:hypothetical protein
MASYDRRSFMSDLGILGAWVSVNDEKKGAIVDESSYVV